MNKEIQERIECIKNNQLPKGYRRIKDIGIAPEDWTLGKMSDVIENVSRPVSKPNEPYWRLGIKSWAKGTFHAFVDNPETVNMDELYEVKENDLIVNITFAWEHAIAIAKKEDDGLLVSHRFPTYVFKEGQVPEYYQAVITQQYFKDMLDHISPGGAGRNRVLNRKDFLNLPCFIPSKEEQQKIAKILFYCDKIINLKEELIVEKRKLKKYLMEHLLSGKKRLCGFADSWKFKKLGDLASMCSGGTPSSQIERYYGDKYTWISISDMSSARKYVSSSEKGLSQAGFENCSAKLYPVGTVLFAMYASVGECAIATTQCCSSQAILGIEVGHEINNEYLYYYLLEGRDRFKKLSQASSQPNLNKEIVQSIMINLPSIEEQKAIVSILTNVDYEIDLLHRELECEKQRKKSLQQLLLTGIVRIK